MTMKINSAVRGLRREVRIGVGHSAQDWIVTLTPAGLEFRLKGHRYTFSLPWTRALSAAERLAGDQELIRRQLRRRGIRDTRRFA